MQTSNLKLFGMAAAALGLALGVICAVFVMQQHGHKPASLMQYADPEYIEWLRQVERSQTNLKHSFSGDLAPADPVEIPLQYYYAKVRCNRAPCEAFNTPIEIKERPWDVTYEKEHAPEAVEVADTKKKPCCDTPSRGPGNFPFDQPITEYQRGEINIAFGDSEPCDCGLGDV
mmetsp:Transcript_30922/g.48472  ORF Transcript_30922/g.48472 Transcript_30922/m.48472 type:complete len:173 (-) Transcript_30922:995-1513(-)